MKHAWVRIVLVGFSLLVIWAAALGMRRAVLSQQTLTLQGEEAPFTMESALQFRMTRMVYETGTLPDIDESVQVPEGVPMRQTYSVGAEWIYAGLSRLLPSDWTLTRRVRWVSAAVFSLSVSLAALYVYLRFRSFWGLWITGGLLAINPSFSVRSSGLELSRENLALPFIALFFCLETWTRSRASSSKAQWVGSVAAAAALSAGQCVWDLTQYVTGVWVVVSLGAYLRRPRENQTESRLLLSVTIGLVLTSILNPYLRAHGGLFSPVLAMLIARTALCLPFDSLKRRWPALAVVGGIFIIWWILGQLFVEHYSHFGELVWAKIRYLNNKPSDPSLLTFAQRIMWTPALNSSTWALTKSYIILSLIFFAVSAVYLIVAADREQPFSRDLIYAAITLPVYVLFFRFHIFLIFFAACTIGTALSKFSHRCTQGFRCVLPVLITFLFLGGELYLLLFFEPQSSRARTPQDRQLQLLIKTMGGDPAMMRGNRWGRPGASYPQVDELIDALNELDEPGPVLANFGISATILAYADLPIVLHPKFETPGIRERVREFYEHLFLNTEQDLRDWAVSFGARYYVHSIGHLSDADIRNSPRYMVDAVEPPSHAPVHVLENHPGQAFWFRPVFSNARYRVYRIITPEDEEWATRFTRLARMALESGEIESARQRAMEALSYHWKYQPAQELLAKILSSRR